MTSDHYACISQRHPVRHLERHLVSSGYHFCALRREDIESIRVWRNEQLEILRQKVPITEDEQILYYEKEVLTSFSEQKPKHILLSILLDGKLIGYGGLVHIDWQARRAEVSFLLDTKIKEESPEFRAHFHVFLEYLTSLAFLDLKLQRLCAEVYDLRPCMVALLQDEGFLYEGTLKDHVFKNDKWFDAHLLAKMAPCAEKEEKKKAVLVTSISKKVPLLQAVREAIKKSKTFGALFGMDMNQACVSRYWVDAFWHTKPLEMMTFEAILEYCKLHHIGTIIPTRDADVLFFAAHKEAFEKEHIFVFSSYEKAVRRTQDKKHFADFLLERGYPAIPTSLASHDLLAKRFVVKERFGQASKRLGKDLSYEEAISWSKHLDEPIFQPYIEGKEYSVDVYRTMQGHVQGVVVRERNVVEHGESQVTTTCRDEELELLFQSVATDLDLYGHAVFQVIKTADGKAHIIECNARFGGASTLSVHVGLESFFWFLKECEERGQSLDFKRSVKEVRQVRFMQDMYLQSWE